MIVGVYSVNLVGIILLIVMLKHALALYGKKKKKKKLFQHMMQCKMLMTNATHMGSGECA